MGSDLQLISEQAVIDCWPPMIEGFSRADDPATGDFHDATVLRKFGDVPDDLSAL
jgi:hypothetical protein